METISATSANRDPAQRSAVPRQSLGQEEFLTLMIAQFRNQDPFKPLESGEFLGQMAQFSTVAGINELNAEFASLASALTANQSLQAASMVGREALVAADTARGGGDRTVTGSVVLDRPAALVIEVYDAAGQLVRELSLGGQDAGPAVFQWDGRANDLSPLPEADYRFAARLNAGGESWYESTLLRGRIDSVSLGGSSGLEFNITGLGMVPFSRISELQ